MADIANVGCEEAQRETERMDPTDNGWLSVLWPWRKSESSFTLTKYNFREVISSAQCGTCINCVVNYQIGSYVYLLFVAVSKF